MSIRDGAQLVQSAGYNTGVSSPYI